MDYLGRLSASSSTALTPLRHLVLRPEQLLCPPPSAALKAGPRCPSEDDRGRAGQRVMLQAYGRAPVHMCPCEEDLFWLPGQGRVLSFHQRQRFPHVSPFVL